MFTDNPSIYNGIIITAISFIFLCISYILKIFIFIFDVKQIKEINYG